LLTPSRSIQSLNELTARELDSRGHRPIVLQNMHLGGYGVNYDEWLGDQRRRDSMSRHHPQRVLPR
jgi:hypothetical protein